MIVAHVGTPYIDNRLQATCQPKCETQCHGIGQHHARHLAPRLQTRRTQSPCDSQGRESNCIVGKTRHGLRLLTHLHSLQLAVAMNDGESTDEETNAVGIESTFASRQRFFVVGDYILHLLYTFGRIDILLQFGHIGRIERLVTDVGILGKRNGR